MGLAAHLWTIWPHVSNALWRTRVPAAEPWETTLTDPLHGTVKLTGELRRVPGSHGLVLVVPGLGGNAASVYVRRAVRDLSRAGLASLIVPPRGADQRGEGIYHAALTADLHAAAGSAEVRAFERVFVLGFSLGGHLALRFAADPPPSRIRAVAAVCAPIDLFAAQRHLDRPGSWAYRQHILRGLKQIYRASARRGNVPTPLGEVLGVRTMQAWDACTVVPRFGFRDVADYYARSSAATRLEHLAVPALMLQAEADPMVRARDVRNALPAQARNLRVEWIRRGGHVGFPAQVRLIDRIARWFAAAP